MAKKVSKPVKRRRPRREDRTSLSLMDLKVLKETAKGKSYREIAAFLGISFFSIDWHVRHIMRLMRAKNMTNAVYKAFKAGIIG